MSPAYGLKKELKLKKNCIAHVILVKKYFKNMIYIYIYIYFVEVNFFKDRFYMKYIC